MSATTGRYSILTAPPGLRSPAWAATEAMVAAGVASRADVEPWAAAFERVDAQAERPTVFAHGCYAVRRRAPS